MAEPSFGGPQNSKWPLWKENRILIKWSVILMATYKTGDLLRSIKFVCMSEGKAFTNYLLLAFPPSFLQHNTTKYLWIVTQGCSLISHRK